MNKGEFKAVTKNGKTVGFIAYETLRGEYRAFWMENTGYVCNAAFETEKEARNAIVDSTFADYDSHKAGYGIWTKNKNA